MTVLATPTRPLRIDDPTACATAARQLADGAVVAHAFANLYAITTRGDAHTVRRVNAMKGRPPDQVGSITGSPGALWEAWDLDRLPDGLDPRRLRTLVDTFFALGPFGFRGPAASAVPPHLTLSEGGTTTAQVITPGYACPSNRFLGQARRTCEDELLYVSSANRSRHLTGADDSPAHWRADGLVAEFGNEDGFLLLAHPDEAAARACYPAYLPMSTTMEPRPLPSAIGRLRGNLRRANARKAANCGITDYLPRLLAARLDPVASALDQEAVRI